MEPNNECILLPSSRVFLRVLFEMGLKHRYGGSRLNLLWVIPPAGRWEIGFVVRVITCTNTESAFAKEETDTDIPSTNKRREQLRVGDNR
jgi:hypothetical protein